LSKPKKEILIIPWLRVVSDGFQTVSDAISISARDSRIEKYQILKQDRKTERLIIVALLIGFLGSLFFSFYLIYQNNFDPVSKFIFPIITGIFGLICGFLAGKGSASKQQRI